MYFCSKCKLQVIIIPGKDPIKACNCKASIIMDMGKIKLEGKGNLK